MSIAQAILDQIPGNTFANLQQADRLWQNLKEDNSTVPEVVENDPEPLDTIDWDVIICGGTLGILIGATLAKKGWRVVVIERGKLQGREQEWNISRHELNTFLELNLLTKEELERTIVTEYNPGRLSFPNTPDLWIKDVLNIGIDPIFLLETLKNRFLEAGGKLLENTAFVKAIIHPNGIDIKVSPAVSLTTRLMIDAMGHFSPVVKQARQGKKPDAVCLVVGTCASGYPDQKTGDIFAAFTPVINQCQYFWEAFPARDGRTTYLFTYIDADRSRISLESLFTEYLRLLPQYQNIELNQLTFKRALFGFFPCYRQSPLKTPWPKILAVGDSSGNQSPLSFGGFGAMIRHLPRLTNGIDQALANDILDRQSLALLQPYQPSLSVTWMFQRSMSVRINQQIDPDQINQLLAAIFQIMQDLGEPVLKPFLQDVVKFPALTQTLFFTSIKHPQLVLKIIPQVGLFSLLDWLIHYINLGIYMNLYQISRAIEPLTQNLSPIAKYYYQRKLEQWQYGSGSDH